MSCGRIPELHLQAYADGELDLTRSLETEAHLAECLDCAATVRRQRALGSALQGASLAYDPPEGLEARVRAAVRKASAAPESQAPRPRAWWAAAAAVPVIAALGWALVALRGPSPDARLDQEIVSAHVRSLMADHLTDVPSSDQHTVKPWFAGKLDFSPEVTDLSAEGDTLVGGRLDYLGERGVAALVYERRRHLINVFVWPEPGAADRGPRETAIRGYNLIRWRRAGTTYGAVSDLNMAELRELVRLLQR